jgi:hypothetical protein
MVMLYLQKDGTMGPQNPVNLTNQNSKIAQANRGGPLQNQIRRDLAAGESPTKEEPGKGANKVGPGVLGNATGMGTAGGGESGLVGSVNTEIQNDDVLLPYTKI